MAGGGQSITLQSVALPALVLHRTATLLGALAACCWFLASISPMQLGVVDDGVRDLGWWGLLPAAAGLAVALLTWFAAVVRGRLGLLVIGALLLGLAAGAALFGLLVPRPNPIHPIGPAVPYGTAGFIAAGAACLVTLLGVAISGGWQASLAERPVGSGRRVSSLIAVLVAGLLVTTAGLVAVDRSRDHLLAANEYRTMGDVDSEPAVPAPSLLTGGDRWRIEVPGLSLTSPALTAYGVAMASGQNVIMVDRATGAIRWRYTRSDVSGPTSVASTGAGQRVLVWWGLGTVFVLDARTGERVARWPERLPAASIVDTELPLIARTGNDGQTDLVRIRPDGSDVWTHRLGSCERARARVAAAVVVLIVPASCGDRGGRVVGLDIDTGRTLWESQETGADVYGIVAGAAILVTLSGGDESPGRLVAVDVGTGVTRWSRELPQHPDRVTPCTDLELEVSATLAALVCTWDLSDFAGGPNLYASTVYTYDARTGSNLQTISYQGGPVVKVTMPSDGRVVVARADTQDGWVLELAADGPESRSVGIGPGRGSHAAVRSLTSFGDQVFVVDAGDETLRCLR